MIRFDPATATDLVDALRLLEGRLRGSGRTLSPSTLELRRFAERSLAIPADHPAVNGGGCAEDGDVALGLYTYDEAAERLRVAEVTVRRLVAKGQLAAVSLGRARRIRPSDLQRFIESLPTTRTKET